MNAILLVGLVMASVTPNTKIPKIERILDGIWMVESSKRDYPPDGDKGKAIGPYQIHKEYWKDGTRLLGVKWSYSDARKKDRARAVVRAYITHYGKGHGEDGMIRVHNGGPNGWKYKSTLKYLQKVKAAMK